jgi:hypothetical protein
MNKKIMILLLGAVLALFSCTKRKPEEVDLAPNSPWNPYPPDSSNNIDHTTLDVTLHWSATDPNSGDVLTYDVYLDTINPPMTSAALGLSAPSYFMTGLNYNTTYYWKIFAKDQEGTTTSSIIWRFTTLPHANTAPNVPSYLFPLANASWQYPTLYLSWNCTDPEGSSDTLRYDLYLGVTPQPPPSLFKNDSIMVREITGLNYTTNYYWKVVVHDNHGAYTSGPVYSFATRDCPWFYKSDLPSPRYDFGTVAVYGKIYVIGGTQTGIDDLSEVLEYDPLLDAWTRKADLPTPAIHPAVTVWDNRIYALVGNGNYRYDPLLDSWSSLTPPPGGVFSAHAINGKIYTTGRVFQYDINTDNWWDTTYYVTYADTISWDSIVVYVDTINTNEKSVMPLGNRYYCSAACNDLLYVMGGTDDQNRLLPYVSIYHPVTNTWTEGHDMIDPANYSAATVANGFIYVLGGYYGSYYKQVRKYDPISDAWFIRSDLQKERDCLGAAFTGSSIYAIGGIAYIPLATVEQYRLDLDPKNARR